MTPNPETLTAACTTAAAATAAACGLPTGWSILASLLGAAVSVWSQAERRDYELTMRTAASILLRALVAVGTGVIAGALWSAMVPPYIATGTAPAFLAGAALVPPWAIVIGTAGSAHVLLPILGRLARRLAGGGAQNA